MMPGRRLTADQITELRARRADGIGEAVLAESFGISRATVSRYTAGDLRIIRRRPLTDDALLERARQLSPVDRLFSDAVEHLTAPRPPLLPVVPAPATWEPACMEPEDLEAWRSGRILGCQDCTTEYSDAMREVGRCNGVPGQLLEGAIHNDDQEAPMDEPTTTKRIDVALTTPCGRCAHEPVCGIKAGLDALTALPVPMPRLDRALTVVLGGSVSCDHFLRQPATGRPRKTA
jgi:hypothetical protein